MNRYNDYFVALDGYDRIVSLSKELFLVQRESKFFDYFKREYGIRIYKIYDSKQDIVDSL